MRLPVLLPPALIAIASLAGLVLTLAGDGVWDWIGLMLLAPSLLAAIRTIGRAFDFPSNRKSGS